MYCSFVKIGSAGIDEFHSLNKLFTESAFIIIIIIGIGARGGLVVKALRYKPEGRGFDSRCCHWNFSVI